MASSSSALRWKYDVFVSFRGSDTRWGFTSDLYDRLSKRGVRTFRDDEDLQVGSEVSPSLLMAIEESRFAIVVLSKNFASSTWCLEELTKICQTMQDNNRVLPVFYDVEPVDVRYQKRTFEEAFTIHEYSGRHLSDKIQQWRDVLRKVASLSGWDSRNYKTERELLEAIVEFVCYRVAEFVHYKESVDNIEFESIISDEDSEGTAISDEDFEATTQAVERTLVFRSQRPYAFLPSGPPWKHDVYLSFSAVDTRRNLVHDLYGELQKSGIKTFRDDEELQVGDEVSTTLLKAIEESRFAIVVLSTNYASSTWCLEELTKILRCMEHNNRILPLFYNIDPSDVKNQTGSFKEAFTNHLLRHGRERVEQWTAALVKVADLFRGWHRHNYKSEMEFVKGVVEFLSRKVREETALWTEDFEATRKSVHRTSEPAPHWKHDVFLSFRGEDTRDGILSHLDNELQLRGIKAFKDDRKLEKGTQISPNLLMAIEESRFAVVVLSANYASSTWCLDELAHIFKCMEGTNTILPIFYKVDPSDVRKQGGSFAEAFTKHENSGQDEKKIHQWREALVKVASLSGWHSNNHKDEHELIEDIGKFVWSKVIKVDSDSTMSMGDFEEFTTRRQAMEQVMMALKNKSMNIIGVYGKGGVGKTTMVKHVSSQAQKLGVFNHVFVVFVSQFPDVRKIQGKLAEMLGIKFHEETETKRAIRLRKMIMSRQRILIVLDNIWKEIDLSTIGIPSSEELQRCSSKVLLTTRKTDVCREMGSQQEINLTPLSEEDSWKLFKKKSGKSFEPKEFYQVARKVAKQCAGLPIALIAVAKALTDKVDLAEWKEVARGLKDSRTANFDDEDDGFNCIKLSYDSLRGEYVKSCFLLCCLFPENDDIRIADLMEYAYGMGLFQDSNTMQEARATTHLAVIYLKDRYMLMDGVEDGYIRMHDVVRNMALSILYKDGHRYLVRAGCKSEDWPKEADEGYSAVSVMRNEILKLPEELIYSELKILLLQGNADLKEIPNNFFQSANTVRVLDLSDTSISLLPPSFSLLKNLHTLYLDGCKSITNLSILKELCILEILSMREFPLKELPREIGELRHLRILDFTSECVDTVPSNVMSRLPALEELYMQCKFMDWGRAGNAGFDQLADLSHLYILKVNISDAECFPKSFKFNPNWVVFDIHISSEPLARGNSSKLSVPREHSRTSTLNTTINTLPDWFIMAVTKKTEKLEYLECAVLKNILEECNYGGLDGLKQLTINGPNENLKELMDTRTGAPDKPVLQKLEELHLVGLFSLKELCVGELPPGSLCNLKLLKVESCNNLVNALLPPIFRCLKILVVTCCMKLKSLFTSDVAQCFLQLEDLSITQCRSLYRVIEASKEAEKKNIGFPVLKNLVLCDLPHLTWFYSTESSTIECPSLEQLHVQNCANFLTSTSDFHTWKQVAVNDLRHLRVKSEKTC